MILIIKIKFDYGVLKNSLNTVQHLQKLATVSQMQVCSTAYNVSLFW